ncbi:lycopene cyclase domain-containing protein [Mumia sp. zg.B53]|uniref:lycopene cyclase domain-containing protein n=1 Tax=unclassified Mumia TaxID=2621872 RepID=UPI001C6EFA2A|nr:MULTISPECIES: lycopene cyclase domain-containing protein [unclassified Mumia]MBW9205836.1 lycopene cyclase domain-containing protein [Mumia sp. zg.B17]MBW9208160.1 lycopene cyclase domain-containing protein [Mumia sp. zg.B21]MBW9216115.1 lycopene cyclase domain-containing protein [Mumia sp. zg.B53]MDD9348224.1 lycopene cyclase domain-containing protein [Mumia sp.]
MTHAELAVPFIALSLAVLAAGVLRRRPTARWWWATGLTMLVLMVLTVVFDSIMIAADLFRYGDGQISGVRIWLAPVEDLTWPVVAALALPGLALLLGDPGEES